MPAGFACVGGKVLLNKGMRIATLKLSNFRNLEALTLKIPSDAKGIALVGANGSGKTSVLEAVSLLTPTRGLLGAENKQQIMQGSKAWGLFAVLESGAEIGQTYRGAERIVEVDGNRQSLENMGKNGSQVWLAPASDFLFGGPPATRRRWLDDAVTAWNTTHSSAVNRFRQHRQARLKLLMRGQTGDWLDAEETLAAEWGAKVLENRLNYLKALTPYLHGLSLNLSGNALEIMENTNPAAALKGKFERSRDIDTRLERTHAGPNTLELQGFLTLESGHNIALAQASSGQHKRGLVQWLAAQVGLLGATGEGQPLVIIDEFSAHLDAVRRAQLLETLTALGCQVWLSDVEKPAEVSHKMHIVELPQQAVPPANAA